MCTALNSHSLSLSANRIQNSKEDFIGGDFKIYSSNNETIINFETGKVYIFESSTPHSVDMITKGNRITLMLFVEKQNLSNEIIKPKSII